MTAELLIAANHWVLPADTDTITRPAPANVGVTDAQRAARLDTLVEIFHDNNRVVESRIVGRKIRMVGSVVIGGYETRVFGAVAAVGRRVDCWVNGAGYEAEVLAVIHPSQWAGWFDGMRDLANAYNDFREMDDGNADWADGEHYDRDGALDDAEAALNRERNTMLYGQQTAP